MHAYCFRFFSKYVLPIKIPFGIFEDMTRNPEQTRQLIIEKSIPIFNTKGYNTTSISDITAATGITKGAIYGNFKNKDDVASAAFDRAAVIVTGQIADRIRKEKTAPDKLLAMVNYYEEYVQNPPIPGGCPLLNSSIEAADNLPFLRLKIIRSIALIRDSLVKIVNRGIQEGQIKKGVDADEFGVSFYAAIEGAISLSRIEGDARSYQHVKQFLKKRIAEMSV